MAPRPTRKPSTRPNWSRSRTRPEARLKPGDRPGRRPTRPTDTLPDSHRLDSACDNASFAIAARSIMPRKILVTSALPYANAALHLGHIMEAVQTDIWVRFQRMRGHDCVYCCAEDAHGTPIMIRAQQEGISPET